MESNENDTRTRLHEATYVYRDDRSGPGEGQLYLDVRCKDLLTPAEMTQGFVEDPKDTDDFRELTRRMSRLGEDWGGSEAHRSQGFSYERSLYPMPGRRGDHEDIPYRGFDVAEISLTKGKTTDHEVIEDESDIETSKRRKGKGKLIDRPQTSKQGDQATSADTDTNDNLESHQSPSNTSSHPYAIQSGNPDQPDTVFGSHTRSMELDDDAEDTD